MQKSSPLVIGVTGGIGSGKSTVCQIFSTLGIPIYDADSSAKKLMVEDATLIKSIKKQFGNKAYQNSGDLNRDYLAQTVFSDSQKLTTLNGLVHPAVAKDFNKWSTIQKSPYVIKEAALLIESGSYKHLDKLINVSSPIDIRIKRVLKRDTFRTIGEINKIIENQLSEKERNQKADYVINNDNSELLIPQVLDLHKTFLNNL